MKTVRYAFMFLFIGLAISSYNVFAEELKMPAPISHSKDFDKMKELAGTWEGKEDMGKGVESFKVTYELTSAGNAIVERFAAGMPHEMVTVYYDFGGKLVMTHYCSIGNQPHMELTNPGGSELVFVLSKKNSGLVSPKEMHMHGLKIAFEGKDAVTNTWTLYDQGVKKGDKQWKLSRVKM